MSRSGTPTRSDRVYSELRGDILAGRHRPGQRLTFAALSTRYVASMGVLREALTRLTGEGLVESEAQYGFRVVSISIDDLVHLTEARCAVETLVLREAVEHGDVRWESEVLAAHHLLERTPQMDDTDPERLSDAWVSAHSAFHHALLSGCPNPRLLAIASSLRDSAELYRRWSVPLAPTTRDIAGEHRALLDAVLAHDAEEAVATLAEHIRRTTRVLSEQVDDGPEIAEREAAPMSG